MNKFHPAKPVSVYRERLLFGRIKLFDFQKSFWKFLRKRIKRDY